MMRIVFVASLSIVMFACHTQTQNRTQLRTQKDSLSYSIGLDIAKTIKRQSIEVNPEVLAQALSDAFGDSTARLLNEDKAQAVLAAYQQQMNARQEEKMRALADKNKKDGDAFLAENKKKKGIVTLPDGLQYKIISMGKGRKPKATETVVVNYRGTFIDGTEFDNSYTKGQPATMTLSGMIRGWSQGVQLMPVGSKWQLFIPGELGFGERGAGQVIPPNSTLIFDVELLSIK